MGLPEKPKIRKARQTQLKRTLSIEEIEDVVQHAKGRIKTSFEQMKDPAKGKIGHTTAEDDIELVNKIIDYLAGDFQVALTADANLEMLLDGKPDNKILEMMAAERAVNLPQRELADMLRSERAYLLQHIEGLDKKLPGNTNKQVQIIKGCSYAKAALREALRKIVPAYTLVPDKDSIQL